MKKFILAFTVLLFSVTSVIATIPETFTYEMNESITPGKEIKIYTREDYLYIETQEPTLIEIYSITGKKVASEVVKDVTSIPLTKGIYLVRTGESVHKVIVK